ncbi:MAG TPA: LamG-like jellyroll fold domain-containing protein [Candidatus Saccharimonadales bacterium]|nr:LamG-like jellyroll fold domain-containing protein [Candidatus Saccharimonadales bacterium]
MPLTFPSREYDEAVAAVCHGTASDEQARALNHILRSNAAARDNYILRLELHSRLASEPDLFAPSTQSEVSSQEKSLPRETRKDPRTRTAHWILALAACVALLASGWWALRFSHSNERKGTASKAVAMLNRVVDAQWNQMDDIPQIAAPLEPGWLRLQSGLAQIVFYSGARVVIEGPAEFQLISSSEAAFRSGRLTAEVPALAHGFRVSAPGMKVTDLGTAFGLNVHPGRTELHVFKGSVEFDSTTGATKRGLKEGAGAVVESSGRPKLIAADPVAFASLFDLQAKSLAAEALRYDHWRAASRRLNADASLLVHFNFEQPDPSGWRLQNVSARNDIAPEATIVGCQWVRGRWPEKQALEFRGVSDRVRLSVAGEFESLTLAAWVRVQGLDRQFNSLFMCDGFELGTVHWLIRNDGALGLTTIGSRAGEFQIIASPPVFTLDQFGTWLHLAVVLEGKTKQAVQYVNGEQVSQKALKTSAPFRIGAAELGNWNASGFAGNDPSLIRNFSGAMDEFYLFSRALNAKEIRALFSAGKPQPDSVAELKTN